MPLAMGSDRVQSQLKGVSSAARALLAAVDRENALPPAFPRVEIAFWVEKLAGLQKGTVEGATGPLAYAAERLVEIGHEYVGPEAMEDQDHDMDSEAIPPLSRSGAVGSHLSLLIAAISYAQAECWRAVGQNELTAGHRPGPRLTALSATARTTALERADQLLDELQSFQEVFDSAPSSGVDGPAVEKLNRLTSDAATHLSLTQHALQEPSPRKNILSHLGSAMKSIAHYAQAAWKAARVAINVAELGTRKFLEFGHENILLPFKYLNQFGDELEELVSKATSARSIDKPGNVPSPGRDGSEAWYPEMVAIAGGSFEIGSPDDEPGRNANEGPLQRIELRPFLIGRYPVTFAQYDHFCADTGRGKPDDRGWGRGFRPVINVSQSDALAYCEWLGIKTGLIYRLPSEAEWEYCCRAGTRTPFSVGHEITHDLANFDEAVGSTTEVGRYPANPWGLGDMHGNVWERCLDVWHDNYAGISTDGRPWLDGADHGLRVMRGGSWSRRPRNLRSACRYYFRETAVDDGVGFRCVRETR
ncbi:MAG: formylglycine-generating enzyme family protein [Allosphingosinicella sp.]